MNIQIINLERSPDRRNFMQAQLNKLNIKHALFTAIDAKRGDLSKFNLYDEILAKKQLGQTMSPGECGCFASHYRLWEKCAGTAAPMIIMEDDIIIEASFNDALSDVSANIDKLHFIRLFGLWECKHDKVASLSHGKSLIRYRKGPIGTQCYAISPTGAERLIKYAEKWIEPVDRYIDKFWLHGLHSYAIQPFPIRLPNEELDSLINSDRAEICDKRRQSLSRWANRWARFKCNMRYIYLGDEWGNKIPSTDR